jgi:hypothetical protein
MSSTRNGIENVEDLPVRSREVPHCSYDVVSGDTEKVLPMNATVATAFAFAGGGSDRWPLTQ